MFFFLTKPCFALLKGIRLNSTHYLIIKTQNKWELPQLAFNYSSDIDFRDFMNLYKKCTAKPYSLLVIDSTLASEISALLSGKINKYEYLTGEEMLPPNKIRVLEHAKFSYAPWGKAFEKQIKTVSDQGRKQLKS